MQTDTLAQNQVLHKVECLNALYRAVDRLRIYHPLSPSFSNKKTIEETQSAIVDAGRQLANITAAPVRLLVLSISPDLYLKLQSSGADPVRILLEACNEN